MAEATVQICLRGDTAANWAAQNPVLAKFEVGIEEGTWLRKTGDGVRSWQELPYDNANLVAELESKLDARFLLYGLQDGQEVGFLTLHAALNSGLRLQSKRALLPLTQAATLTNSLNASSGSIQVGAGVLLTVRTAVVQNAELVSTGGAFRYVAQDTTKVTSHLFTSSIFSPQQFGQDAVLHLHGCYLASSDPLWATLAPGATSATVLVDDTCFTSNTNDFKNVAAGITVRFVHADGREVMGAITENTADFYHPSAAAQAFYGFTKGTIREALEKIGIALANGGGTTPTPTETLTILDVQGSDSLMITAVTAS